MVFKDDSVERRARNQRNIGAVWCGRTSGFGVTKSLFSYFIFFVEYSWTIRSINANIIHPAWEVHD